MFNIKRDIYEIECEMRRRYNRLKNNYVYPSFGGGTKGPATRNQFSETVTIGDITPDEALGELYDNYGQNIDLAESKSNKKSKSRAYNKPNYNHPAYAMSDPSSEEKERRQVIQQEEMMQNEVYDREKALILQRAKILNQEKFDREQERLAKEEEKRLREKERADAQNIKKVPKGESAKKVKDKENSQINIMYDKLRRVKARLDKITAKDPKLWTGEEVEFVKTSKQVFGSQVGGPQI